MQFVELRVSFHMMTSLRKIPFCCFFLEDTVLNHPHHFSSTSADMLPNTFLGGQHISALSRDHLFTSYPILFFLKEMNLKEFIYFWLHWVFIAVPGRSLVAAGTGYSLLAVLRLLTAVVSLAVELGLQGVQAQQLCRTDLVASWLWNLYEPGIERGGIPALAVNNLWI